MSVDFALIGHQESWDAAAAVVAALRGYERPPIPAEDLRDIFPWIPARTVCRVTVGSSQGNAARGVYIDSFMPPDRLDPRYVRENLARMREAAACAIREGAGIATLGGFSSVLLESKLDLLPHSLSTAFTTGNTLTVALIVEGIERSLELAGRDLAEATILIVGATGDVGSGCARCLAPRAGRLLLCGRNWERLERLASELSRERAGVVADTDVERLAAMAGVVICAASLPSPALLLSSLPWGAIVCDAGYPKNVLAGCHPPEGAVFFGGLGQATGGFRLQPDLSGILNRHPFPNVAHGCLLEGMALALEGRFEAFSSGRGRITPDRVREISSVAHKHGIKLAPLFGGEGPVEERISALAREAVP